MYFLTITYFLFIRIKYIKKTSPKNIKTDIDLVLVRFFYGISTNGYCTKHKCICICTFSIKEYHTTYLLNVPVHTDSTDTQMDRVHIHDYIVDYISDWERMRSAV